MSQKLQPGRSARTANGAPGILLHLWLYCCCAANKPHSGWRFGLCNRSIFWCFLVFFGVFLMFFGVFWMFFGYLLCPFAPKKDFFHGLLGVGGWVGLGAVDVTPLDAWILLVFSGNLGVFWFFGQHKMLQQLVWCHVCPGALDVVPEWLFLCQPAFCNSVIHIPNPPALHETTKTCTEQIITPSLLIM